MMENINAECKCPYGCPRHGNCRACQDYHKKDRSRTNCGKTGNSDEISNGNTGKEGSARK